MRYLMGLLSTRVNFISSLDKYSNVQLSVLFINFQTSTAASLKFVNG